MNSPIYDKLIENGWDKFSFKSQNAESDTTETLWFNYDLDNDSSKKKLR